MAKTAELEADELLNTLLEISKEIYDAKLGNGVSRKESLCKAEVNVAEPEE